MGDEGHPGRCVIVNRPARCHPGNRAGGLPWKRRPSTADWFVNLKLPMPGDPFWLCAFGSCLSCLKGG